MPVGEAEVQIRITDMNDNTPFFAERVYTARVPENSDSGAVIITVTAKDMDEGDEGNYLLVMKNLKNKQKKEILDSV